MRQLLFENQKQQLILYTILKKMQILTLKKRPIHAKSGENDPFKTIFSLKINLLINLFRICLGQI